MGLLTKDQNKRKSLDEILKNAIYAKSFWVNTETELIKFAKPFLLRKIKKIETNKS